MNCVNVGTYLMYLSAIITKLQIFHRYKLYWTTIRGKNIKCLVGIRGLHGRYLEVSPLF